MAVHAGSQSTTGPASEDYDEQDRGYGWVAFARSAPANRGDDQLH